MLLNIIFDKLNNIVIKNVVERNKIVFILILLLNNYISKNIVSVDIVRCILLINKWLFKLWCSICSGGILNKLSNGLIENIIV